MDDQDNTVRTKSFEAKNFFVASDVNLRTAKVRIYQKDVPFIIPFGPSNMPVLTDITPGLGTVASPLFDSQVALGVQNFIRGAPQFKSAAIITIFATFEIPPILSETSLQLITLVNAMPRWVSQVICPGIPTTLGQTFSVYFPMGIDSADLVSFQFNLTSLNTVTLPGITLGFLP